MGGGVGKYDRVHEATNEVDASKEDGHDGDKFWDGSIHGATVRQLELANAEGLADDFFKSFGFVQKGDFHPKKKNGDVAWREGWEADGIFFGGDEGEPASGSGAGECVFDLGSHEAVVISKGALINDFGTQFDQAFEEAFRHSDSGNGTNP